MKIFFNSFIAFPVLLSIFLHIPLQAQKTFPEKCTGNWEGTMHIYAAGQLKDSVQVLFTVDETENAEEWIWKTEYLSEKHPMVKDYKLRFIDKEKNIYGIDEGDGILLKGHLFGNKMYSIFETSGILLTSSYEVRGETLIFEVTSGKKPEESDDRVTGYPVSHLQRVVLTRIP